MSCFALVWKNYLAVWPHTPAHSQQEGHDNWKWQDSWEKTEEILLKIFTELQQLSLIRGLAFSSCSYSLGTCNALEQSSVAHDFLAARSATWVILIEVCCTSACSLPTFQLSSSLLLFKLAPCLQSSLAQVSPSKGCILKLHFLFTLGWWLILEDSNVLVFYTTISYNSVIRSSLD